MSGERGHRLGVGLGRRLCLAIGLGIGLFGAFGARATPAWATGANQVYDEALPVSSSSPPDRSSYSPTTNRVRWEVVTMHGLEALYVRVATQGTLGNVGTPSTLNAVDDFGVGESNTYGYYTGASNGGVNWWPNRPGQYYWQAVGIGDSTDPNTGVLTCQLYAGPVYTITIAAPQPAPSSQQPPPTTPITSDDSLRARLNGFGPKIVKDENPRATIGGCRVDSSKRIAPSETQPARCTIPRNRRRVRSRMSITGVRVVPVPFRERGETVTAGYDPTIRWHRAGDL
jgi:hypothetical protein